MPTTYAIPDGRVAMAATLYTGTNSNGNAIVNTVNGVGFQPDWVWAKSRANTYGHNLFDSVRGVYKNLGSNGTYAEETNTDKLVSFNSNGFTVNADQTGSGGCNFGTGTYVAWQWKAGGAAVSNTAGSITSQVSANTTAGFSVVTYTGTGANATVGHGLGVAPSMVITKGRDAVPNNWGTWHTSLGALGYLYLNNNTAAGSLSTFWNSAIPTSSVFSLGSETTVNTSSKNYVAYCFAPVAGYSAFGGYTGNGSADGPFLYLGFRARFVFFKITSGAGDWYIYDTSRDTYNVSNTIIYPNGSFAENQSAVFNIDMLSNGIKIRNTSGANNTSGATYIYMAFAENPFKYANAR
jgi:hypothetical protein